jgi:hypothetical protein
MGCVKRWAVGIGRNKGDDGAVIRRFEWRSEEFIVQISRR